MSDGFMLYLDDDGVARHYDDTYDITIHCESEEEQRKAIEQLKSLQWIPCSERLPEHAGAYLVTTTVSVEKYVISSWYSPKGGWMCEDHPEAWMPLPEPYKEVDHETD